MPLKMIQVGTGSWGAHWCRDFLPPNIKQGLVEVVAAVDLNPQSLECARSFLGLREDQCYTDPKKAFAERKADFCTVVVPPAFHESVVDLALSYDMHILSEKPIADSLLGSVRIADKTKRSGKKMAVTMSHRFDQDKTTLRQELRSGRFGQLDYLISRFTCDTRRFASTGVEGEGQPIPLLERPNWANTWLIEKFVRWIRDGEPMETNVEDNLQSVALIFAAIKSSQTGSPVAVQALLREAQDEILKG